MTGRTRREPRPRSSSSTTTPWFDRVLRSSSTRRPDCQVCGEADDAPKAMAAIKETKPDMAIVDLSLEATSGLDLIEEIEVRHPKLPILVLSMHDETLYAERALRRRRARLRDEGQADPGHHDSDPAGSFRRDLPQRPNVGSLAAEDRFWSAGRQRVPHRDVEQPRASGV